MAEMDAFDRDLVGAFLRLVDEVPGDVDGVAVAHRVAQEHPRRRTGGRSWGPVAIPRLAWLLLLVGLLLVAVAGVLLVGSGLLERVPWFARDPSALAPRGSSSCHPTRDGTAPSWRMATETSGRRAAAGSSATHPPRERRAPGPSPTTCALGPAAPSRQLVPVASGSLGSGRCGGSTGRPSASRSTSRLTSGPTSRLPPRRRTEACGRRRRMAPWSTSSAPPRAG